MIFDLISNVNEWYSLDVIDWPILNVILQLSIQVLQLIIQALIHVLF